MRICVILLTWNDGEAAARQYRLLLEWRSMRPHVVLVENGGSKLSDLVAPNDTYISNESNLGYAGGINAGLRRVDPRQFDAVMLLNNDADISEDDALKLAEVLRTQPNVGIVGPVLEETHQGKTSLCYGGRDPLLFASTRIHSDVRPGKDGLIDVAYVPGTVLLLRTALIEDVGLLDEDFFFSGEIADLCRRARESSWRCAIAPAARAHHAAADESRLRSTLYRYYTLRNRFLMARRLSIPARLLFTAMWTSAGLIMWCKARAIGATEARAVALALNDGLTGRFGNRNELFDV